MKCALFMSTLLAVFCPLSAQPPMPPQQTQPGYPPGGVGPANGRTPAGVDPTMGASRNDTTPVRIDDKTFLKHAAVADMMQVELGKLAAEKGSSDGVRQFGRKMAADCQKANEEVMQLAARQGVSVADTLDAKHKGKVDKLAKLDGAGFDKAFLKEQTRDDRDDIAEFQAEAQSGSDAAVKSFATRILPMVQAHQQLAKDLESGKNPPEQPHH